MIIIQERDKEMKRIIIIKLAMFGALALVFALITPASAFAHVVVTPNEALTGAYETFTTNVPNEKDIPVIGLRVVIPNSIDSITPTVKPGWEINTKKNGDKVTEIIWTGGTIPAEQRDTFSFSAHLSEKTGNINWKAYQTYQDGSVVSWDQEPAKDDSHESEDESKGPYSVTTISNESSDMSTVKNSSSDIVLYVISIAALVLSAFTLIRTAKK